MLWRKPTIRAIAKSVLGALLFAQVALAAHACVMPAFRPAAAFSAAAAMPDCEQTQAAVDVVCLVQCLQSDQTIDWLHDFVAAPPPAAFASNWLAPAAAHEPAPDTALSTGPPVYLCCQRLRL